ncbi:MAG: hypothetical protein O7E56_14645 [SAR324 cluster bacterium]|nr:hypothetical protein [SAR324 cluster bacterium]MCZ6629458.1 hypothetical protein [SAR324 cluster bacterium]MCZ6729400.1 hypothetical protein [SAR324 cluster bacterium]MCZ6841430.1 hypothetical protein [SAR324 cluster bacterium]
MVINDLKTSCAQCNGSGRSAGITSMGISQINPSGICPHCKGRGFLLTELGEDLVNLLRPFVEEMIAEAAPAEAAAPKVEEEQDED